jgi:hypothetical protein
MRWQHRDDVKTAEQASRRRRRPSSRIKCVYNDNGVSGLKLEFFGVKFFGGYDTRGCQCDSPAGEYPHLVLLA